MLYYTIILYIPYNILWYTLYPVLAYEEAGSDTEYDEENDREEEEGEEVETENQEQAVENEDIEEDDEEGPDAAAGDQDDAQMAEEPAAEEDAAQADDNNPGLVASFLNDSEGDAGADLDSEVLVDLYAFV